MQFRRCQRNHQFFVYQVVYLRQKCLGWVIFGWKPELSSKLRPIFDTQVTLTAIQQLKWLFYLTTFQRLDEKNLKIFVSFLEYGENPKFSFKIYWPLTRISSICRWCFTIHMCFWNHCKPTLIGIEKKKILLSFSIANKYIN